MTTHTHTHSFSYFALLLESLENGDFVFGPDGSVDHKDAIQMEGITILQGSKGGREEGARSVLGGRQTGATPWTDRLHPTETQHSRPATLPYKSHSQFFIPIPFVCSLIPSLHCSSHSAMLPIYNLITLRTATMVTKCSMDENSFIVL